MEKQISARKTRMKKSTTLIFLCWLVYAVSYLGKVNYSANITQIETFYGVSHADAGMVSTFFFFAYGAGQIVNGLFCKRYNTKYVVFGALLVSALANFGVALLPAFSLIKYLWLVNGMALSVLWPCLIGYLAQTLRREDMARASVVMGTTVATGTLIIYGLSSVYAAIGIFKLSFYTAALAVVAVALIWLFAFNRLRYKEGDGDNSLDPPATEETKKSAGQVCVEEKQKTPRALLVSIVFLALFAVATNLVAEGLTTWVPSILKETYGLSDSISILLTLCLPLLAIFGNIFAQILYKKTKSFVANCGVLFLVAGLMIAAVLGLLQTSLFVLTIICFAIVRFMAGGSNSTITSIFPLYMKGKVNSGMLAGVLNGFCYVGSTISSYGLGVVAENFGWSAVFYLLLGVCATVCLLALAYGVWNSLRSKKK